MPHTAKLSSLKIYMTLLFFAISIFPFSAAAAAPDPTDGNAGVLVRLSKYAVSDQNILDSSRKITFYKDLLPEGKMVVTGAFKPANRVLQAVEISIDNRLSWQPAILEASSNFRYAFAPADAGDYTIFVRALLDGKVVNDIEQSKRVVTLSAQTVREGVQNALDGMVDAYRNKSHSQFMKFVDPNFRGDDYQLAWALRRDFSYFAHVDLRLLINNYAAEARGLVSVMLHYNRTAVSTVDGKSYTDQGITQMSFKPSSQGMRVYSMKQPILFGVTYAGAISSGGVISAENNNVLVVSKQGQFSQMPISDAMRANDSSSVVKGTVALSGPAGNFSAFRLSTQTKTTGNSSASMDGDFGMPGCNGSADPECELKFANGTRWERLTKDIDEVTTINQPTQTDNPILPEIGITYALQLTNGKYALIKLVSASCTAIGGDVVEYSANGTFKYRYQPSGSKIFN